MAAAVRIGAFLALIAVLFAAAYAAGARLGPVTPVHSGPGGSGGSGSRMNMGAARMNAVAEAVRR